MGLVTTMSKRATKCFLAPILVVPLALAPASASATTTVHGNATQLALAAFNLLNARTSMPSATAAVVAYKGIVQEDTGSLIVEPRAFIALCRVSRKRPCTNRFVRLEHF